MLANVHIWKNKRLALKNMNFASSSDSFCSTNLAMIRYVIGSAEDEKFL